MKIRILFELSSLGYGGTEKAIYTFLENLDRGKFEPYVFFYTDYKTLPYYRRFIKSLFSKKAKQNFYGKYTINTARLDDFKKIVGISNFFYGNTSDFFKIIKTITPDIIHFNRGVEETFFTKNIHKIPTHITLIESNIFGKTSNPIYIERINQICFVSKWLIQQSSWSPKNKTTLLYNPIKFPTGQSSLRNKLNIPESAIVLGRMSRPNLDDGGFVAEVFHKIVTSNIYFLVIGASRSLQEKLAQYDHVVFIDPTTDTDVISQFYNTIDILLHYRKEGETFGMNIAEAMIHGKPVISHESFLDNAQIELLLEDENAPCGIVVKENDINGYITAAKTLINDSDQRLRLGKNARQKAKTNYAEDVVTKQLEQYYLELYGRPQILNDL